MNPGRAVRIEMMPDARQTGGLHAVVWLYPTRGRNDCPGAITLEAEIELDLQTLKVKQIRDRFSGRD
jgi:hypothetical protein